MNFILAMHPLCVTNVKQVSINQSECKKVNKLIFDRFIKLMEIFSIAIGEEISES